MMAQSNPFDQFDAAAPRGRVLTLPPDPLSVRREDRADQANQRAADAAARAAQNDTLRVQLERIRLAQQGGQQGQQQGNQRFDNLTSLRKEFAGLQATKDFNTILPMITTSMRTAARPNATGADDLSLIYTFGKVMDPGSVVREGELALAQGTGSWAQSLEAAVTKLKSGERLPPAVRHNLIEAMRRRASTMGQAYNQQRSFYEQLAQRNGFTPGDVVGPHPAMPFQKVEQEYLRNSGVDPMALGNGQGRDAATVATGATRREPVPAANAIINSAVQRGLPIDQVNAQLQAKGIPTVRADQYAAAVAWQRNHPQAQYAGAGVTREVPTTWRNRSSASPAGVLLGSAADAAMLGMGDELVGGINSTVFGTDRTQAIAAANLAKQAAYAGSPRSAFAGQLAGTAGTAYAGSALSGAAGLTALLGRAAPYIGNVALGAAEGAGQNNDSRATGAALGAAGGLVGQVAGERVIAPAIGALARTTPGTAAVNQARALLDRIPRLNMPPLVSEAAPSPAVRDVGAAMTRADPAAVQAQLAEAARFNLPMMPADTHPELRELAAAAVRRSPTAAQVAEGALVPRSRGQIDRLGRAVEQNLGPVANIPQVSEDLTRQAQTAAGPLYDAAYQRPGASSVALGDLMQRPSMRAGIARARNIAAEEGRDPTTLGFDLDPEGNVTLTRVPSFQTLDYVKRGLDDTLEPHRNPITGRLQLNEATRAINATKNDLLRRVDTVNPDYAAARQAYAGPVQARDALARGQDAFTLNPDELGMQVATQTPEHLSQMQTGYRSALMGRANAVRDTSNPFEATLGTPSAQQRLTTLYPGNPGVERLLHARELERRMAETANGVLGNSRTAQRGLADEAFAAPDVIGNIAGAGVNLATGGGAGELARSLIVRGLRSAGGRLSLGNTIAKADEIAPILLNSDPVAASAALNDLLAKVARYQAFRQATTPTATMGRLGAATGQTTLPRLTH